MSDPIARLHTIVTSQRDALVREDYTLFETILERRAAAQQAVLDGGLTHEARRLLGEILVMDREMESVFQGRLAQTRAELEGLAQGRTVLRAYRPASGTEPVYLDHAS